MSEEVTGEVSSESGGLSEVEAAAFNDPTPIEEYGQEITEETDTDEENSGDGAIEDSDDTGEDDSDDGEDEDAVKPASFTDLEAANKHIAKLNRENAKRRTESKEYENVFSKFDDDTRPLLLGLIDQLGTDPEAGARQLVQVAKNILGEDALKEPEFNPDKPMTFKEYEALKAKEKAKEQEALTVKQQQEEQERAVNQILSKADELGYPDKSPDRLLLLSVASAPKANGGTEGDLDAAHAQVEQLRQKIIQDYIDGKSSQANQFPVTGEGGQPGNAGKTPTTWRDFEDQAIEMANAAEKTGK